RANTARRAASIRSSRKASRSRATEGRKINTSLSITKKTVSSSSRAERPATIPLRNRLKGISISRKSARAVDFAQPLPYTALSFPIKVPPEPRLEAYLSAEQNRPQAPPWLSRAHGDGGWSRRSFPPSCQGPQAAFGLRDQSGPLR